MDPKIHPSLIENFANARAFAFRLESLGCGTSAADLTRSVLAVEAEGGFGAGAFGVRRPLRFLTYKLGLSESQVAGLARILDELKTERAQAAVDDRRTLAALADALSGGQFDEARAAEGAELRRKGASRLSDAVVKALAGIHALLTPEQRDKLAYLIRTGTLAF
jgi:Spy/CpxP family protein refolding chaperone